MVKASGRVYLVGAGPGDPDLISIKGARLLASADVLLFDHLINRQFLKMTKPECQLVDVGKRCGKHVVPQEKTNELMVEYAKRGFSVVRLKGGDPFVFGRGGEEMEALVQNDIAYEVVPGISSSLAAPAYAGVPVTYRKLATSFAVITGHMAPDNPQSMDWASFAKIDTLVVLMGVKNRQQIARELLRAGRPADQPVVFIQQATVGHQKVVNSTLSQLAERPPEVQAPAVMVIGEVAGFQQRFDWFFPKTALGEFPCREPLL